MSILLGLVLFLFPEKTTAQNLIFIDSLQQTKYIQEKIAKKITGDSLTFHTEREQILSFLESQNFLSSAITQLENDSIFIFLGRKFTFRIDSISSTQLSPEETTQIEADLKKETRFIGLQNKLFHLQKNYQDQGFAFCSILSNAHYINDTTISIQLHINKGECIHWHSIITHSETLKKTKFMPALLGIYANKKFSQTAFDKIPSILNSSPFLESTKPASLFFTPTAAVVVIYPERKPSNRLDGLVGLQQNENKAVELNGYLNLQLFNSFSHAEEIQFNWAKNANASQQMAAYFSLPYLWRSQWGTSFKFELSEIDSSYSTYKYRPAISYHVSARQSLAVFYEKETNKVIVEQTNAGRSSTSLWGVQFSNTTTNNPLNPREGWEIDLQLASGTRSNAQGKLTKVKVESTTAAYWAFAKRWVFKTALRLAVMRQQKNSYSVAELFRVGGFNSLRGFYEQEFTAYRYGVGSFEMRYLFEEYSRFMAFIDLSAMQNPYEEKVQYPLGWGIGTALGVSGGQFTVFYSLGQRQGEPISLSTGKLHIGYVSVF